LSKQAGGFTYDCERNSQAEFAKWIEKRRAQARVAVQLDPAILETYVGQYQYDGPPIRVYAVTREGSRLFADIPKNEKTELFAESESQFFLKIYPDVQMTFTKKEGRITGIEFFVDDTETWTARRIE
jgi:hypothetical protein